MLIISAIFDCIKDLSEHNNRVSLSHLMCLSSLSTINNQMHYFQWVRSRSLMGCRDVSCGGQNVFMGLRNRQAVTQPASGGQEGSVQSSMCGGCFPQDEQPAWPQLSKPQALGEDGKEGGRARKEEGGSGGQREGGGLGKGQTG